MLNKHMLIENFAISTITHEKYEKHRKMCQIYKKLEQQIYNENVSCVKAFHSLHKGQNKKDSIKDFYLILLKKGYF